MEVNQNRHRAMQKRNENAKQDGEENKSNKTPKTSKNSRNTKNNKHSNYRRRTNKPKKLPANKKVIIKKENKSN